MNVRQLAALASLSLLTMSNSCKKEEAGPVPCAAASNVEATQIAGLTACITEPIPNIGQSLEYVINSKEDYAALFACATPPPVDFSTHTLLAGKTQTASCGHLLAQQVVQTCTGYTYTVKLQAGVCDAVTNVVYYALVPKMAAGAKVTFDVQLLK